ncbi:hypothetical protein CTheo_7707 [Ceratobasidium theobromae]|uniref:Uncharacterized protein n=1 Tax=Ceratobasidium theobromae TaxID=1582974 RepID=A0A5N5QBH0_9AGAM|nr:hypothetical protein CTheo_7707 [Ceratobasidium theobromae]
MPIKRFNINGIIANITNSLDRGFNYVPSEKSTEQDAAEILKQVEEILKSTKTLLENHQKIIPPNDLEEMKTTYSRFHWQMTDQRQAGRATNDRLVEQTRIMSQLYIEQGSHKDRAKRLLHQVETFETRVLSASKNSHPTGSMLPFDDEISDSATSDVESSRLRSYTSWLSFGGFGGSSSTTGAPSVFISLFLFFMPTITNLAPERTETSHIPDGQGYTISVTHFPKSEFGDTDAGPGDIEKNKRVVGEGKILYGRILAIETKDKRIEVTAHGMVGWESYALGSHETYIPEDKLLAMSNVALGLLCQPNGTIPRSSSITTCTNSSRGSTLEATIQEFQKMYLSNDPAGDEDSVD